MSIKLFVQEEGAPSRVLDCPGPVVVVGRGQDSDVVIADNRSSRRHCRLCETPQGIVIEDLKSSNGTLVGGKIVTQGLLQPGDEFVIGSTRIRLQGGEGAAPSLASPGGAVPRGAAARREPPEAARSTAGDATTITGANDRAAAPPSRAADAEGYLELVEGELPERRIPIAAVPFTIGRSDDCDLKLRDSRISSRHAQIIREGTGLVVVDLDSRNGVLVNGKRVERGVLAPGTRFAIGGFTFTVHPRGAATHVDRRRGATGPRVESPGGAPGIDAAPETLTIRLGEEELRAAERVEQPLAIAAALVIVALVAYFSFDVAQRLLVIEEPDPRAESNLITGNWSFEVRAEGGSEPAAASGLVPGWALLDTSAGRVELTADKAQPPGFQAAKLVPAQDGVVELAHESLLSLVGEGRRFVLEGFVAREGGFVSGLYVDWLRESSSGSELLGRSYAEVSRGASGVQSVYQAFAPPALATHARVVAYHRGGGGSSIFDRISLARVGARGDGEAGAPAEDLGRREYRAGNDAEFIAVDLLDDGAFSVRRNGRRLLSSFWAALPPAADPLLVGPRLSGATSQTGDGAKALLVTYSPDFAGASWFPVGVRVHVESSSVRVEWRLEGDAAPDASARLVAYLESSDAGLPVAVYRDRDSSQAKFLDTRADGVRELVLGAEKDRTSVEFSTPVSVRARPHPLFTRRWILEAEPAAGARELHVVFSAGSRRQSLAATRELRDAQELFQAGKVAEAVARLERVKDLYPEEAAEIAQATALLGEWKTEAGKLAQELRNGLVVLRKSPSSVVFESYLARGRAWSAHYRGTAAGEELAGALAQLESEWLGVSTRAREAADRQLLDEVRQHMEARRLGIAELCLRAILAQEAAGELPSDDVKRQAIELLGRVEGRRRAATEAMLER